MSSAVIHPAQPAQILKGLGKVWTSLGEEEKHQGKPTVLRACAMTLIVATDEADGGFCASQTISELMREHPSRGIVLAVSNDADKDLQARVLAQCWKPFGKAQQICCEQIEITASPANWPNVAPTVNGIMVADLPVIFWCRHSASLKQSATADQTAGIEAVMNLATKTIVDSKGEDARTAIQVIQRWRSRGRIVADLEWTRLTRWREPIAQIFDNAARQNKFSSFHTIELSYSGSLCASVLYMASWLSAPYNAKVNLVKTEGYSPGLHRVVLRSDREAIEFERSGADDMTLRSTNGRERKYCYTEPGFYVLMNEELSVLGVDPVFDKALQRAPDFAV